MMDIQNEVQDFSMPSKKHNPSSSPNIIPKSGGNKLDDTLSKLMKRKNCVSTIFSNILKTDFCGFGSCTLFEAVPFD